MKNGFSFWNRAKMNYIGKSMCSSVEEMTITKGMFFTIPRPTFFTFNNSTPKSIISLRDYPISMASIITENILSLIRISVSYRYFFTMDAFNGYSHN